MKITQYLFYYKRCINAYISCICREKKLKRNARYQAFRDQVKILNMSDTVSKLMEGGFSVSRYGDGEFYVMGGGGNSFQQYNSKLAEKLKEVLANPLPNLLLCIPMSLVQFQPYTLFSRRFILDFLCNHFESSVEPFVNAEIEYGDALFTRFYMNLQDKSQVGEYVKLLKQLWSNREVLIVEGEFSRLGVGNDLFDNVKSIKRVLCPSVDAFSKYDQILDASKKHGVNKLVILAIGMTATVLAYDLAKCSMQALDLGHIDVEYEWFKRKTITKIPLPYKAVNEANQNTDIPECNVPEYLSSIVERIN